MTRQSFFDKIRRTLFNGKLSQPQVTNIEILLDTWQKLVPNADKRWVANSLAQIFHETGGRMEPVRETFAKSDAVAKSRLERAWLTGQLSWVKEPYWRDGWYGRGHIQLTHRANYLKMEKRTGYKLTENPDLMLDYKISAEVSLTGMIEGLFTGRKLSDYFNSETDSPINARRIVNGADGMSAHVSELHKKFLQAL